MPKRYLFFYRNNSDIDHLSPVIYGLIKNGVDANLITYSDLWPHQSLIHCKRDPRLNYLKQLGVNVEQSEISMLYIHLYNFYVLKNCYVVLPLQFPNYFKYFELLAHNFQTFQ